MTVASVGGIHDVKRMVPTLDTTGLTTQQLVCAVTAVLVRCYYSLDKELFAPNSRRVVTRVRTTGNNLAAEWAYRAPDWLVASGFSYSSRAESSSDCICVAHIAWTLILTMLTAQCSHSPVHHHLHSFFAHRHWFISAAGTVCMHVMTSTRNLSIANRSRVSCGCAYNTSTAGLGSLKVIGNGTIRQIKYDLLLFCEVAKA